MHRLTSTHLLGRAARAIAAITCALGVVAPIPAAFAGDVDTIVVRYRDDVVPADAGVLPSELQNALGAAVNIPFAVTGQTRDGAFRLQLANPHDLDEVRAALNRVRLDPSVLYANVAPGLAAAGGGGPPTDRLIVKYRAASAVAFAKAGIPLAAQEVDRLIGQAGVAIAWRRGLPDGGNVLQLLQRMPVDTVETIAQRIAALPEVDYAQPDYIRTAQVVPTDPCYASAGTGACSGGYQWDLFEAAGGINMPAAWDVTTGSAAVNVAVIDTGALFNHPDLAGRFVVGYDMIADCAVANDSQPSACTWSSQQPNFLSRDSDAADPGDWVTAAEDNGLGSSGPPYNWFQGCGADTSSWHGTHVAGTIGAVPNNGIGVAGINWVSKIVPVRVLGKCGGYTSDIAAAIVWAAGGSVSGAPANNNPARVLNLSLGGGGSCDATSQNAINTALGLGAVVVVSAGNSNQNAALFSPASCSGVITVAATIKNGARARYSNYGVAVEIAAPGGNADGVDPDILSTLNSGTTTPNPSGYNYVRYAGTSMAAPHVTGVASLMLSVNPALTPAQVLSKIQTTARAFPAPGPACNPTPQASACNCTTTLCGSGILDAGAAVVASIVSSTTTLASSANPAAVGTAVTFTATVSGNAPTGTVDFKDGGSTFGGCGAVALTGSGNTKTAQCTTSALAIGTHGIVATYGGDGSNPSSSSAALSQVITLPATTTTLASSSNPATLGASITFTATVTGASPTGTVDFKDGGATFGGCGAVALTGAGNSRTATCTTSALAVGSHGLAATYGGDGGNAGSTSTTLVQVVNAPTGTSLTSDANPAAVGALVTLTATVTGVVPTGTVDFKDGAASIAGCAAVALAGGGDTVTAKCATASLAVGTHTLTAVYSGNRSNPASTSAPLAQVITGGGQTPTTTSVASSQNPSTVGASVTFTATVTGNAPTGTVDFRDGASSITGCAAVALSGSGNSRTAACTTSALSQGSHSITANYGGDAGNAASASSTLTQVVNAGGPTTSTTSLASNPNPSNNGAAVTFTATVTGTAPTGTVNFRDGAASVPGCSAVTLAGSGNSRTAVCITSALSAGTHAMTAVYGGDGGNTPSVSNTVSQVVNGGTCVPTPRFPCP